MIKTINIGGKDRPVKYNLNALIEFDELTGLDLTSGVDAKDFSKPKSMRALSFVGLKHGAKAEKQEVDFTIDDVGEWLGFGDGTMEQFFKAFQGQSASNVEQTEPGADAKK